MVSHVSLWIFLPWLDKILFRSLSGPPVSCNSLSPLPSLFCSRFLTLSRAHALSLARALSSSLYTHTQTEGIIKSGWLEKRSIARGSSVGVWRAMECVLTEKIVALGKPNEPFLLDSIQLVEIAAVKLIFRDNRTANPDFIAKEKLGHLTEKLGV